MISGGKYLYAQEENEMALVTFKGTTARTRGQLPRLGSRAPDFVLTKDDLSDVSLADFKGKRKILNIVVSLDTGVCAASARAFNTAASELPDTVILERATEPR
jgi:thiol peroxidase